ncbi:hypothetical protein F5051DRAFT_451208 [Lentinula edodes]|nr:hypothetical protein F5051DRAFT_451208 [Lentinula edodes]
MTATPGAVAILLSVASSVIQVYAAAIPSASSPPPGKFPDDLDIPRTSTTPHIQSLPTVSVRNTPPTAVSSSLEFTSPMRVNSITETGTREYDYLTPRRLDSQKKGSLKKITLDPSKTENTQEEGKENAEDLKPVPSQKKQSKQQKVETDQQRLEWEQLLAERQRMRAAIPKPPPKSTSTKKTTKTTPTTPNVTKVPEKKNLNNPLVNPIINNIVYGNGQNGPSFSKPHPKSQKTTNV